MNTTVKYFKYRFLRSLIILPIVLLVAWFISDLAVYSSWYGAGNVYLNVPTLIPFSAFYCMFIPIYELHAFNNKRNLDLWFSLPVSRQGIMGVHYLVGLINTTFVTLVLNVILLLRILSYGDTFYPGQFINILPWYLIFTVVAYSLSFFAFTLANNTFDGCVFVFAYFFVFNALASAINYFVSCVKGKANSGIIRSVSITSDLDHIVSYYQDLTYRENPYSSARTLFPASAMVALIIWLFVTLGLVAFVIYMAGKRDSSKVGGVSDNILGYQILIPAYALAFELQSIEENLSALIGFAIFLAISFTVYRRGFKYKVQDFIVCGVLLALFIVLNILCQALNWGFVYY